MANASSAEGSWRQPSDGGTPVSVFRGVMIPMRDGTRLAADIYLPSPAENSSTPIRHPALLQRTPYGKSNETAASARAAGLAARGYAVVIQDKRGRHASEGVYKLFDDDGDGAHKDGYDTIEWVAHQPWCNGKVGMWGVSYMGHTGIAAATTRPPHLLAAVVTQPATDMFTEERFVDGVFLIAVGGWNERGGLDVLEKIVDAPTHAQAMAELVLLQRDRRAAYQTLPITDVPYQRFLPGLWADVLAHRDDPSWFANTTTSERMRKVGIPILHMGSWYDPFLRNNLRQYRYAISEAEPSVRAEQRLFLGPWLHGQFTSDTMGHLQFPDAAIDYERLVADWHDRWLKGAAPQSYHQHPVIVYVMGENRWRADESWPATGAVETPLYLRESGRLDFEKPADERPDSYDYDPKEPYAAPTVLAGPQDHSTFHRGANLLVYTTEPLPEEVEVIGPLRMSLFAASSGTDTDWMVEVHDLHPDGRSIPLAEGITRARYRYSRTKPEPLTPGRVERFEIDVRATADVFKRGHAIRVVISSGKSGRFERNPNAFVDLNTYTEADMAVAHQTIYHDSDHASALYLYIVPERQSRRWIANPVPARIVEKSADALSRFPA